MNVICTLCMQFMGFNFDRPIAYVFRFKGHCT